MSISNHPSAAQLQQVLEAARVGYWEWLPEADRLWVDERLAGWLGARPDTMAAYRALTRDRQQRDGADWYRVGRVWIEERGVRTQDGRVFGACVDVTDRRRRERALSWEAEHDPLTGLLSRRTFDRVLERALATTAGDEAAVSLLMVDLDGFKAVNDRLGHASGDQVLRTIAQRLRGSVRRTDPVARWGGDEFALVLDTDAGGLRAGGVAQRLLVACRQPVGRGAGSIATHASIGLAVSRVAEDAVSLARRADHALYEAKGAGGDRWCLDGWAP
jgi:diguanylate cyclase (GGDEF)-like protein